MRHQTSIVAACILLVVCATDPAYSGIPVIVTDNVAADDEVGGNLVFKIKDELRGSYTFTLVTDQPDSVIAGVSIATLANGDYATAYSVAFIWSGPYADMLMQHAVGICGEARIATVAVSIVGTASEIFAR